MSGTEAMREAVLPQADWQWLADQLRAWPNRRVHPERTMCEAALRPMAADVIEAALALLATDRAAGVGESEVGRLMHVIDRDRYEATTDASTEVLTAFADMLDAVPSDTVSAAHFSFDTTHGHARVLRRAVRELLDRAATVQPPYKPFWENPDGPGAA